MNEIWESSAVLLAPMQKLSPSPLSSLNHLFSSLGLLSVFPWVFERCLWSILESQGETAM